MFSQKIEGFWITFIDNDHTYDEISKIRCNVSTKIRYDISEKCC